MTWSRRLALAVICGLAACDPGSQFTISNPCQVEIHAAVFLDSDRVPTLTSYRKLVTVPPGEIATDADLGRAGDTVALVVRVGRRQQVFEVAHRDELTIPEEACDGIE